jgi:hypothetical protein
MENERLAELLPQINEAIRNHGKITLTILDNGYHDFHMTFTKSQLKNGSFFRNTTLVGLYFNPPWVMMGNPNRPFTLSVASTSVKSLKDAEEKYIKPMKEASEILSKLGEIDPELVN